MEIRGCFGRKCAFESNVLPEDWRSGVIAPLYKGKEERTECNNYKNTGKIYGRN